MGAIAAILRNDPTDLQNEISAMLASLANRGPGNESAEALRDDGIALGTGAGRLDGRPGGAGLAWDGQRRCVIVLDGRIDNADELRRELSLRGHNFAGGEGDARVVVEGYAEWREGILARLKGSFALAIWERDSRTLFLGRDRFGEKPLVIARLTDGYAIASKPRAFLPLGDFVPRLDVAGLDQYLCFRRPLAPRTMFEGVQRLPGGHYATIRDGSLSITQYWGMTFEPRAWKWPDLLQRLDETLDVAVQKRLAGTDSAGISMSGGLDSAVVGYYLARNAPSARAYTAGFELESFDETDRATATARYLKLDHEVHLLSDDSVAGLLTDYAAAVDEPLSAGSTLARFFLNRIAAQQVESVFVGDGGDEARLSVGKLYRLAWPKERLPRWLRSIVEGGRQPQLKDTASLLGRIERVGAILRTPYSRLIPGLSNAFRFAPRDFLSPQMRASLPDSEYAEVEPIFAAIERAVPDVAYRTLAGLMRDSFEDDSLRVLDHMGHAASLEMEAPFGDADLIDLLATVPASMRMKGPDGKNILRTLMQGRIPDELLDQPKRAFLTPMASWLRGPLRPLLMEYAAPGRIAAEGIFDPGTVSRLVQAHLDGREDNHEPLRYFLMFELWRERWLKRG